MSSYQKPLRLKLLFWVILLTLSLHLFAFYRLKTFTFSSLKLMIPKLSNIGDDPIGSERKQVAEKNEELSHIFSRLAAKNVPPSQIEFEFKNLNTSQFSETPLIKSAQEASGDPKATHFEPSILSFSSNELQDLTHPGSHLELSPIEPTFELSTAQAIHHPLSLLDLCEKGLSHNHLDLPLNPIGLNEPIVPSSQPESQQDTEKRMIASSSDFMVHIDYAPRLNHEGFIFKISLLPKPHKQFKRIRQNFFFLVDRSHSIPQKHYQSAKEAIAKVIEVLHPDDTFNVFIFDGKMVKLSEKNLKVSPKNIQLAKSFLKAQKHGGFFATTDLYSSLDRIVPSAVEENEVNVAILLSDGDTFLGKDKQRKTLYQWTQKNKGKVSLFSLAMGKKTNVPLLDLLSIFNKGSIRIAKSPAQISSELTQLIQSLNSPIGKDLTATILPHHTHAKVNLFPSESRMPNLYEHLEYVLYGSIDKASDFTLFLQGHYYDNWLDIKKTITLSKGTLSDESCLKKNLLLQQAYQQYEQFLRTGHPEFLTQAKELLKPIALPLAFE